MVLYVFISLVSYSSVDASFSSVNSMTDTVLNLGGPFGAYLSDALFSVAGMGAYLILFIISFAAIRLLFFFKPKSTYYKFLKIGSAVIFISSFSAISEYYFAGDFFPQGSSGGVAGDLIFTTLSNIFGVVGSLLFITIFLLVTSSITLSFSWLAVIDGIGHFFLLAFHSICAHLKSSFIFLSDKLKTLNFNSLSRAPKIPADQAPSQDKPRELNLIKETAPKYHIQQAPVKAGPVETTSSNDDAPKPSSTVYKSKNRNADAEMPSTDLLDRALDDGSSLSQAELNQLADLLEVKLDEFGVIAKVVSVIPGPVVTRFEIQPAPGTKASKITNIAQDIARSLSVMSVRVVEVIEGKSVIGVEIPNTNRKMVRLTEILSSAEFSQSVAPLSMALGQDIAGNPVVVDLAKMPHLLVAGTTGSGKSVGVNAMLLSLLFKSDPKQVRFIMIDPKVLELSVYEGIPHLLTPVITDMSDAANGLRWCVAEMDRRYKLMSAMGVRGLDAFN
ncbi:MAG: DNA translocase FtsK 4TM domain-containing protein, partial [Gammaproteobacteria bacterium]